MLSRKSGISMSTSFFILYSIMSLLLLQNLQVGTCQLNPIQNYERKEEKMFKNQDTNSKKEITDDFTFRKICNAAHNSSSCFFLSPKNITYHTQPESGPNCTYWEGGRICVKYIIPNQCSITISTLILNDIGEWNCINKKMQLSDQEYESDVYVVRRMDFNKYMEFIETFNITLQDDGNKNPTRLLNLPISITFCIGITFFLLFSFGVVKFSPNIRTYVKQ